MFFKLFTYFLEKRRRKLTREKIPLKDSSLQVDISQTLIPQMIAFISKVYIVRQNLLPWYYLTNPCKSQVKTASIWITLSIS